MLALAAVVLAVLASLVAFGVLSGIVAAGLGWMALACLAAHIAWPLTPWRRSNAP